MYASSEKIYDLLLILNVVLKLNQSLTSEVIPNVN